MPGNHIIHRNVTGNRQVTDDELEKMKNTLPKISKEEKDQMTKDLRDVMKDFN